MERSICLLLFCLGPIAADVGIVLDRWTDWGDWSDCSRPCGGGLRFRSRTCHVSSCGNSGETRQESCNQGKCPEWGRWSPWGPCDRQCGGGGFRTRTRQCEGGSPYQCGGPSSQRQECANNQCPVWTRWTPWTRCTHNVGGEGVPIPPRGPPGTSSPSIKWRTRNCDFGTGCTGDSREFQICPPGPSPPGGPGGPPSGPRRN